MANGPIEYTPKPPNLAKLKAERAKAARRALELTAKPIDSKGTNSRLASGSSKRVHSLDRQIKMIEKSRKKK